MSIYCQKQLTSISMYIYCFNDKIQFVKKTLPYSSSFHYFAIGLRSVQLLTMDHLQHAHFYSTKLDGTFQGDRHKNTQKVSIKLTFSLCSQMVLC